MQNTFSVKKMRPSTCKVESYLEVNAFKRSVTTSSDIRVRPRITVVNIPNKYYAGHITAPVFKV